MQFEARHYEDILSIGIGIIGTDTTVLYGSILDSFIRIAWLWLMAYGLWPYELLN